VAAIEEILTNFLPLVGGIAGITLIYAVIMTWLGILRNKREDRMEKQQQEMEKMIRDLWIEWIRTKGK
jgi:hypothetical protein